MLQAAGHRAVAAGNVGTSLADVVTEPEPYEVVAVELSSFQLHWSSTIVPFAAVVLNVAAHHLDWHGTLRGVRGRQGADLRAGDVAIGNADDGGRRGRMAQPRPARAGRCSGSASPGPASSAWPAASWSTGRSAGGEPAASGSPPCRPVGRDPAARPGRPRRTTSPTRSRRRRWPAPTACRAGAVGAGLRGVPARPAPDQPGRQRRRGPLRRRLQGDQPARRRRRRSPPTTRSSGSPAGCSRARTVTWTTWSARRGRPAARRRAVRRRPGHDRAPRWRDTRRDVPVVEVAGTDTGAMDLGGQGRGRAGRARAIPCCSPRRRSRSTCSATTRRAGTRSRAAVRRLAARAVSAAGLRPRAAAALSPLDRPLTSYYLILGTSGLLLALGLVMVLSTSSALQLDSGRPPYCVFVKQLLGAAVGLAGDVAARAAAAAAAAGRRVPAAAGGDRRADPGAGVRDDRARRRALDHGRPASRSSRRSSPSWRCCCGAPTCWPARRSSGSSTTGGRC